MEVNYDLRLIIFMAAISFILPLTHHVDAGAAIVDHDCIKLKLQNASNYFHKYSTVLNEMESEMSKNKVASRQFGKAPMKTFVFSQCREDLSDRQCEACFDQINRLLNTCLPASRAHVCLEGCYMRLESYNFNGEAFSPFDWVTCGYDSVSDLAFKELVEEAVKKSVAKALHENKFAMEKKSRNNLSAFSMATCYKNLSSRICAKCLSRAADNVLRCLPKVEGRVVYAGCFLRYTNSDRKDVKKSGVDDDDDVFLYVIYVVGAVVSCIFAVAFGFCVGKATYKSRIYRSLQQGMEMDLSVLHKGLTFLLFKYSTLEKATDYFNETNKLGHGGFGEIFKGTLQDGREIAIKRLFISRKNRIKAICNEMDIMSRAHHKNLVCFLGCCFTKEDSFVVYEYVPNRSLDRILFDPKEKKQLHWKTRLGIIIGTAEGLEYLHSDSHMQIIHRDIKAGNILLDLKLRPKIADFGLARFWPSNKSLVTSTAIAGTLGYMAPEYIANGQLTEKVDVYSFGVLVLEIVSGVQNNKFQSDDGFETLVTSTWKHFEANTVSEIIDKSLEIEDIEEVKRVVRVGLLCTQESPTRRPKMSSVVKMLKQKEMTLPTPSKPPFTDECMELSSTPGLGRRLSSNVSKPTKNFGS